LSFLPRLRDLEEEIRVNIKGTYALPQGGTIHANLMMSLAPSREEVAFVIVEYVVMSCGGTAVLESPVICCAR
jgi:hypothetical protein